MTKREKRRKIETKKHYLKSNLRKKGDPYFTKVKWGPVCKARKFSSRFIR